MQKVSSIFLPKKRTGLEEIFLSGAVEGEGCGKPSWMV